MGKNNNVYAKPRKKVVIARNVVTKQSHEFASLPTGRQDFALNGNLNKDEILL